MAGPCIVHPPGMTQTYNAYDANASVDQNLQDADARDSALRTDFEGSTAPGSTVPYAKWADSASGVVKRRNAADDGDVVEAPLLENAGRMTVRIDVEGGLTASEDFFALVPISGFVVEKLILVSDTTTSGSDGSNHWSFQVANLAQAVDLFATAPDTNGSEVTADTAYVLTPDQNEAVAANDVLELQVVKTGTPTNMNRATFLLIGYTTG